jgi:hypothetical protein
LATSSGLSPIQLEGQDLEGREFERDLTVLYDHLCAFSLEQVA